MTITSDEVFDRQPLDALIKRHRQLPSPHISTFGSIDFLISEDVFDPSLTNASRTLLEAVDFRQDERVLDIFTGCGAFAVLAALNGADAVTAVDISPAAIRCTVKNAGRQNVHAVVSARCGTFADCVSEEEQFDLIMANPPLLPGSPLDPLSAAVLDPGLNATLDFIRRLPQHLSSGGRCYLLTSDVFDRLGYDVDALCRTAGLEAQIVVKAEVAYETYRVHQIRWDSLPASCSSNAVRVDQCAIL
jgi:methylase of polypeptide subunit release factors